MLAALWVSAASFLSACCRDAAWLPPQAWLSFASCCCWALLSGPNQKSYAVRWLGSLPNREEVARRASPIHYVRKGLPPILTIHGDADPTVPYQHAIDYHKALDKAGVKNQLVTVPGGKHGGFTSDEYRKLYKDVFAFLEKHGVI